MQRPRVPSSRWQPRCQSTSIGTILLNGRSSLSGPIPSGAASIGQSMAVCITNHVDVNRTCHVYIIHSTIKSVASVSAPASSSKTPPLPSGVASIGQLMVVCITTHADMNWACHAYTIQSTIKSIASMSASVSSSKTPPLAGGRVSSIGQA